MATARQQLSIAIRRQVHAWEGLRLVLAEHLGLGHSEFIALGHLYDSGSITASDLGERLHLTSGSVTALINRLEAAGYAERVDNPDDRRSVLINSTAAGDDAWAWVLEQTSGPIAKAVRGSDVSTKDAIRLFDSFADQVEVLTDHLSEQLP
jgi:DNA-binding MarR family transcriptional regulator